MQRPRKQRNQNNKHHEKMPPKLIFKIIVLCSFGMALFAAFAKPEQLAIWIGVMGVFGGYLSGIPDKLKDKIKSRN